MKKMTEKKKNMLKELIKQLHTGASQQKIKERFIPLGHSARIREFSLFFVRRR